MTVAAAGGRLARLLGDDRHGWRLVPLLDWMLERGQRIADPVEFVTALVVRLEEAGAPIWRVRVSFRTLHPEVLALGFGWLRGSPVVPVTVTHEVQLSDAFIDSPMERTYMRGESVREHLACSLPAGAHPVLQEIKDAGGTDYLTIPMHFTSGIGGVFTIATDRPRGFDDRDIRQFETLATMATPLFEAASTRHIARSLLNTYVGPRTGERVLKGKFRRGDAEDIDAAIWFSDLRDFTALTESMTSAELLAALNAYFELVAAAVTARGGEVLRFIGDAMLIIFPASPAVSEAEACRAALSSADDAFASLGALNHRRRRAGQPVLRFGVGLHVGRVIYGNVGAPNRLDFTVMGTAVNRTARLESLTKSLGSSLLMSAKFAQLCGASCKSLGTHALKGVNEPAEVFALES